MRNYQDILDHNRAMQKRGKPELAESEKRTHEAVGYEYPSRHDGQHCSICKHYIAADPPRCEGVKSPIRPGDWCERFRR